MERTKLTQQEFANKTGISAPNLSSIFTGRTNPTNKHVQAIHAAFPDVSINWLLFGEGDPYISSAGIDSNSSHISSSDATTDDAMTPLFPSDSASAPNSEGCILPHNATATSQKMLEDKLFKKLLEHKVSEPQIAPRTITEIRVFFDDGTYETFSPSGK